MRTSFSFLILFAVSLVLVLCAIGYYLLSKIQATEPKSTHSTATSDAIRSRAVTDLASKISYIASSVTVEWPTEWQQVGTATEGCQVSTRHCSVALEKCFDIEHHANKKFIAPVDPVLGTTERTGYAIRKSAASLEIRSCYGEGEKEISQELRF